ncbi:hypothetical protein, partial [Paraburkholderia sp. XV]|uniref:hypothetical protein n=1 Tax=Paraburkholderia sp. XV TaxID=2831520 RepID=UPI001CD7E2C2
KKSRCRPAQGRRVKRANVTRMPAQTLKHRTATLEAGKTKSRNAAQTQANQTCRGHEAITPTHGCPRKQNTHTETQKTKSRPKAALPCGRTQKTFTAL